MKKLLALPLIMFLVSLAILGCDGGSNSVCDTSDPLKLIWLSDTIADLKAQQQDVIIQMGEYKGKTAFQFVLCCPTCRFADLAAPNIYNCLGQRILDPDYSAFTFERDVYRKEDSACS